MDDIYYLDDIVDDEDDVEDSDEALEMWDEINDAESWLNEHEDLWIIGDNGFEFFTEDIPESVLAYAKNWNDVQDSFTANVKLRNALSGK